MAHWLLRGQMAEHNEDGRARQEPIKEEQHRPEQNKGYDEAARGWFQCYCGTFMGRRCPDDERQIKRCQANRRHIAQIRKNCPPGELECRRRQRQALLHWAYDSRRI